MTKCHWPNSECVYLKAGVDGIPMVPKSFVRGAILLEGLAMDNYGGG